MLVLLLLLPLPLPLLLLLLLGMNLPTVPHKNQTVGHSSWSENDNLAFFGRRHVKRMKAAQSLPAPFSEVLYRALCVMPCGVSHGQCRYLFSSWQRNMRLFYFPDRIGR